VLADGDLNRRPADKSNGYKPRLLHARIGSLNEITPSESASNLGHASEASSQRTVNGGRTDSRNAYERRTERTKITTRDSLLQTRTKQVVKQPEEGGMGSRTERDRELGHRASPPPRKAKARQESKRGSGKGRRRWKAGHADKVPGPWEPKASLIEHGTAPLASRISIPPSADLLPEILDPRPLRELSADEQESAILDDLLYVFMGFEGQYIRYVDSYKPTEEKSRLLGPEYQILPGLDPSLRGLTEDMLRTATHYVAVEAFIEVQSRDDFGTINHALCAAMRRQLKEYLILIAQMEHQLLTNEAFTLHVLHLHMLSTSNVMFQLHGLAQEMLKKNQILEEEEEDESDDDDDVDKIIAKLTEQGNLAPGGLKRIFKGGSVLRILTERLQRFSGDPLARKTLEELLRDASKPYMVMLNEWLHRGTIKDPHGEFLIKESSSINRDQLEVDYTDEYWEKRYTLRDGDVPPQLEAVKDKVLLAGKYLNVVRECGGVDISKEVQDVPKTFDDPRFLNNIGDAYAHANSSLLDLLLTTHELPTRLRSMKHYFFLDRSDFFSYFLYLSKSELEKQASTVNVGKLQSLLDLVIRQPGTVAAQDLYKDNVHIQMNNEKLTKFLMGVVNVKGFDEGEEMTLRQQTPAAKDNTEEDVNYKGYEALEFKYSVPFPLSLVISSKTVLRYQILFRYLLSMRHLEDQLVGCWEDAHKVMSWTHRSSDRRLEIWKRRAWTLRARMLNFVEQFTYYCTSEVIEPRWHELMAKVRGTDKNGKPLPHHTSRTVDELMEDHVDFLDTCLKECMLMNPKLLRVRIRHFIPRSLRNSKHFYQSC